MNDRPEVMVLGDDATARQLRSMLVRHNVNVLGLGTAVGLSVEQASALCIPLERPTPRTKVLTDEDRRRIAAAEEKRTRRAAKRTTNGA